MGGDRSGNARTPHGGLIGARRRATRQTRSLVGRTAARGGGEADEWASGRGRGVGMNSTTPNDLEQLLNDKLSAQLWQRVVTALLTPKSIDSREELEPKEETDDENESHH